MSNMNLPGVRRIEALISVLKAKEKEEVASVSASLSTKYDIRKIVDEEFGLTELRRQVESAIETANAAYEKLNEVTGEDKSVKTETNYRYGVKGTDYDKRVDEMYDDQVGSVIDAVKRKYAEKESALWLVESIEQAKAIVYG